MDTVTLYQCANPRWLSSEGAVPAYLEDDALDGHLQAPPCALCEKRREAWSLYHLHSAFVHSNLIRSPLWPLSQLRPPLRHSPCTRPRILPCRSARAPPTGSAHPAAPPADPPSLAESCDGHCLEAEAEEGEQQPHRCCRQILLLPGPLIPLPTVPAPSPGRPLH